jgi:hypothetical protein
MEARGYNPRFSFKGEVTWFAGEPLDKAGETARAVAAHFTGAAIPVIEFPSPVGFARGAGDQQDYPIGAYTALAIAQPHDLVAPELALLLSIIQQDKIVSGAIHFGERQKHRVENNPYKVGMETQKTGRCHGSGASAAPLGALLGPGAPTQSAGKLGKPAQSQTLREFAWRLNRFSGFHVDRQ